MVPPSKFCGKMLSFLQILQCMELYLMNAVPAGRRMILYLIYGSQNLNIFFFAKYEEL